MIYSYTLQTAQLKLYNGLSISGQLSYFDAIYGFNIPQRFTQSKANLVSASFTATETGTPNFQAGYGYYGNGSGSIFLTLLNPTTGGLNFTQNDAHISILNRNHLSQGIELGQFDGSRGSWIASRYSDNNTYLNLNGATGISFGNLTDTRGWLLGERFNNTQITLSQNTTVVNTLASNSVGIANLPFYALATNSSGSVLGTSQSSKILSLVTIGKSGMNKTVVYNLLLQFLVDLGFPLQTSYGLGDSLMFGTNASTQAFSFFNQVCVNKHYDWKNLGVAGQKISAGAGQPSYNIATTPTKTTFDKKLIINWGLNDTYDIYFSETILLSAVTTGLQAFIDDALSKGWVASDILLVTDFQIQDNAFYTVTEYQTVTSVLKAVAISNSIPYLSITNAPVYTTSDGVHPTNNTQYKIIADYIIKNS